MATGRRMGTLPCLPVPRSALAGELADEDELVAALGRTAGLGMLGIGRSASALATGAIVVSVAARAEAVAGEAVATEVTLGPFRTAQKRPPAARSATSATTGIQTGNAERGGMVDEVVECPTPRLPSVVASVRARAISPREEPVPRKAIGDDDGTRDCEHAI